MNAQLRQQNSCHIHHPQDTNLDQVARQPAQVLSPARTILLRDSMVAQDLGPGRPRKLQAQRQV